MTPQRSEDGGRRALGACDGAATKGEPASPPPPPPPDYWLDDSVVSPPLRAALGAAAPVCGLARPLIELRMAQAEAAAPPDVAPDATYRTFVLKLQLSIGVEGLVAPTCEVRRFGRVLLGYVLGEDDAPAAKPEWLGIDVSGEAAPALDSFYQNWREATPASLAAGKSLAAALPEDMESHAMLAAMARELNDEASAIAAMAPFDGQHILPRALQDSLPLIGAGGAVDPMSLAILSGIRERRDFLAALSNSKLSRCLRIMSGPFQIDDVN